MAILLSKEEAFDYKDVQSRDGDVDCSGFEPRQRRRWPSHSHPLVSLAVIVCMLWALPFWIYHKRPSWILSSQKGEVVADLPRAAPLIGKFGFGLGLNLEFDISDRPRS